MLGSSSAVQSQSSAVQSTGGLLDVSVDASSSTPPAALLSPLPASPVVAHAGARRRQGTHLFSSASKRNVRDGSRLAALNASVEVSDVNISMSDTRLASVDGSSTGVDASGVELAQNKEEVEYSLKDVGERGPCVKRGICRLSCPKLFVLFLLALCGVWVYFWRQVVWQDPDPCFRAFSTVEQHWRNVSNGYGGHGNAHHAERTDSNGRRPTHLFPTYQGDYEAFGTGWTGGCHPNGNAPPGADGQCWYRFIGVGGDALATRNPGQQHCGVKYPGWLAGAPLSTDTQYPATLPPDAAYEIIEHVSLSITLLSLTCRCARAADWNSSSISPPAHYTAEGTYPAPEDGVVERAVCFHTDSRG
jgi:hypothetical protein